MILAATALVFVPDLNVFEALLASEAARIDGASELGIWWYIIVPLVKAVMAVIAIFTFQNAWEDFMGRCSIFKAKISIRSSLDCASLRLLPAAYRPGMS